MPWLRITASRRTWILSINHISSISQYILCQVPIPSTNTVAQQLDTLLIMKFHSEIEVPMLHCCVSILSSIMPPLLYHGKGVAWLWEFHVSLNLPLCLSHFSSPAVHLLPSLWSCVAYQDSKPSSWWEEWVFHNPVSHCSCCDLSHLAQQVTC